MTACIIYLPLLVIISGLIASSNGCPGNVTSITFNDGFMQTWGNTEVSNDGNSVKASLLNNTGSSGFASRVNYTKGLFSANIKLPSQNYTAGIVVTFYMRNSLIDHDEIDFEFLGHTSTYQEWILQTNFYAFGSSGLGREERYNLSFNPSQETHKYSIYWDENHVIYYIDEIPIREVQKVDGIDSVYPSRPMSLYATIWDGSSWATDGGRSKANFTFQPFVAEYSSFGIDGCWIDPIGNESVCGSDGWTVCGDRTSTQLVEYTEFRKKHLVYSYCLDRTREYNITLPECDVQPGIGRLK